jgi:hypothetical protein
MAYYNNGKQAKRMITETANAVKQLPGCLPEGYSLDSLLTVEQFAMWRRLSVLVARRKLPITPGVIRYSKRDIQIHPRTYLDKKLKK